MPHLARPEPDWLSEFADETKAPPDERVQHDPPLALQLEPETTARGAKTDRLAVLAPMVLLAGVSAAIGVVASIMRPGDLPDVRRPAPAELALPPLPSAPLLAEEPRESKATNPGPISDDPGLSARNPLPPPRSKPARQAQDLGLTSPRIPGSTPHEIETAAVQDVLDRYRASLATSSTERIDFDSCGVELSAGGRATARCTGRATFAPKRGGRSERVVSRAWSFGLSRVDDRWILVSVESR